MAGKTLAAWAAAGEKPEVLYWVGCAASFDDRAQRVARAFVKLLDAAGVKWGILGTEETCT
ncbi:MAG: (Fe-S)-binding protein, partial [Bacteroidetes bacterium]